MLTTSESIIGIRISKETKEKAKKLARKDGRTLSNYIRLLIERELKMCNDM